MEQITSRKNPLLVQIRKLTANRAFRRQCGQFLGDGGKLLEEVIRLMQLDGYEKFYLWAIDGNEIADGFYRKHGFLRTGDVVDYKIGGEPVRDVRYTRVLPSA